MYLVSRIAVHVPDLWHDLFTQVTLLHPTNFSLKWTQQFLRITWLILSFRTFRISVITVWHISHSSSLTFLLTCKSHYNRNFEMKHDFQISKYSTLYQYWLPSSCLYMYLIQLFQFSPVLNSCDQCLVNVCPITESHHVAEYLRVLNKRKI